MARSCFVALLFAAVAGRAAGTQNPVVCHDTPQCTTDDMDVINTAQWSAWQAAAGMAMALGGRAGAETAMQNRMSGAGLSLSASCFTCQLDVLQCGFDFVFPTCSDCATPTYGHCMASCVLCQEKRCSVKQACGGEYNETVQLPFTCAGNDPTNMSPNWDVANDAQAEVANLLECRTTTTTVTSLADSAQAMAPGALASLAIMTVAALA